MIGRLDREPLDAIAVSTYDFRKPAFGTGRHVAALSREATGKPIMICDRIHDRASGEEALGDADIVLSRKSLLLNPDWIAHLRAGKPMAPYSSGDANIAYTDTPLP